MQIIYNEHELTAMIKAHILRVLNVSEDDGTPVNVSLQLTSEGMFAAIGINEPAHNLANNVQAAAQQHIGLDLSNMQAQQQASNLEPVVKRTRRTKEQIALDDAAVAAGFKDHAEQQAAQQNVEQRPEAVGEVAEGVNHEATVQQTEAESGNVEQQASSQESVQNAQEEVRGTDGATAEAGNVTNATDKAAAEIDPAAEAQTEAAPVRKLIFGKKTEEAQPASTGAEEVPNPTPRRSIFAGLNKPTNS